MTLATLGLAFVAGLVSILSPCVLPLVPIVLGTAVCKHRYGPFALAAGLAIAFVVVGMFVATIGFGIGLDDGVFRSAGAVMMIVLGVVLLVPTFEMRFATATGPVTNWAERRFSGITADGLGGQFGVGLLLGAVWTPCVGPTLGAASVMAAQGQDLAQVALTMLAFGIGTAVPLVLLGLASREALTRWRRRMVAAGHRGRLALGAILMVGGVVVLSGLDRQAESALVRWSPQWITDLTTRF